MIKRNLVNKAVFLLEKPDFVSTCYTRLTGFLMVLKHIHMHKTNTRTGKLLL